MRGAYIQSIGAALCILQWCARFMIVLYFSTCEFSVLDCKLHKGGSLHFELILSWYMKRDTSTSHFGLTP